MTGKRDSNSYIEKAITTFVICFSVIVPLIAIVNVKNNILQSIIFSIGLVWNLFGPSVLGGILKITGREVHFTAKDTRWLPPGFSFKAISAAFVLSYLVGYIGFLKMLLVDTESLTSLILLALSMGMIAGIQGLTVGHHQIHHSGSSNTIGRLLFLSMAYQHLARSHLQHHVHIGTREDFDTPNTSEAFYSFFWRTIKSEFIYAFRESLFSKSKSKNDKETSLLLIYPDLLYCLLLLTTFLYINPIGLLPLVIFFTVARFTMEMINYVQHYGCVRTTPKVAPDDSVDFVHKVTNWILFYGGAHGDHHLRPGVSPEKLNFISPNVNYYTLGFNLVIALIRPRYYIEWRTRNGHQVPL